MSDRKQFIYILKAERLAMLVDGPTPDESAVIDRHVGYLSDLADTGVVVLFGRTQNTDETTFGLVIFEAESEKAAAIIMANDPAIEHKLMRGSLFPYLIAGSRGAKILLAS